MLVARVLFLSKKTKPLDFTACLAATSTCSSSSSSSSLLCCNPQRNGYLTTTTRSFAILSSSDYASPSSFNNNNNNNLKSINLQLSAFSLSRSFSDSKPKPTAAPLSDDSSGDNEEDDISTQDLIKLVYEKDQLLHAQHKEILDMKDQLLRTFADVENLCRASSVIRQGLARFDQYQDTESFLKSLLELVFTTSKKLEEGFKKFGIEKYDPLEEQFDPHRHNAVFQVPHASKPPGTVVVVLKSGYMLHGRIVRPAEVVVTKAVFS